MNTLREIVRAHLPAAQAKLLEIGAYDRPTFTKQEANIFFLDVLTQKQLAADAESSPSYKKEAVVPVDYVVESNDYGKYVHDTFDAVIADNVFEHISNPIKWLETLQRMLNPDGFIFLCIPEYDQIFDRFRQPTPLAHLINDYIKDVPDLDPEHSLELSLLYDMNYVKQENVLADRMNMQALRHAYDTPHFGVHCHAFSSKTFEYQIIKPMLMLDIMPLSFVALCPTYMSFVVVLQNRFAPMPLTYEQFVYNNMPIPSPQSKKSHSHSIAERILRKIWQLAGSKS